MESGNEDQVDDRLDKAFLGSIVALFAAISILLIIMIAVNVRDPLTGGLILLTVLFWLGIGSAFRRIRKKHDEIYN